jgi:hypothetical protein
VILAISERRNVVGTVENKPFWKKDGMQLSSLSFLARKAEEPIAVPLNHFGLSVVEKMMRKEKEQ